MKIDKIKNRIISEKESRIECKMCPLKKKHIVVMDFIGDQSKCDILFVGINPGNNESKIGFPFTGKSGNLLRNKIGKQYGDYIGHGLSVGMTNAILCSTRNEKDIPDVKTCIENCKGLTTEIFKIFNPKIIVPIGRHCCNYIFGLKEKITKISGKIFQWEKDYLYDDSLKNCMIIPLVHPANLLYGGKNRDMFNDIIIKIREVALNG